MAHIFLIASTAGTKQTVRLMDQIILDMVRNGGNREARALTKGAGLFTLSLAWNGGRKMEYEGTFWNLEVSACLALWLLVGARGHMGPAAASRSSLIPCT